MAAAPRPGSPAPLPPSSRLESFRAEVLGYWREHGRGDMPWRETRDPYRVWVSEVMLQQTQVARVLPAYEAWMERFPDIETLAGAPLSAVLESWQGLGYNRRAVALKRAAETVVAEHRGVLPAEEPALLALPGIGSATAAGIRAFAYGLPALYLETNVRAALLHAFFGDRDGVPDRELLPVLEVLLPGPEAPGGADIRTWYYALMDWGAHLKRSQPNPSRRSKHHARQSPFEGSHRQKRARTLRLVMERPGMRIEELAEELAVDTEAAAALAAELVAEGFLGIDGGCVFVKE